MNVYETMLLRIEKYYTELESMGWHKDDPYMILLRELMEKTIEIIKKNEEKN